MTTPATRDRLASALLSAAATALFGWSLIAGLGVRLPTRTDDSLRLFELAPDPPPPREEVVPERVRSPEPEGEAAPPNLRARPKEVVAPPPVVLPPPPPVLAAPIADIGPAPTSGATDRPGPGTGAGGEGSGRGAGGSGDGTGGGREIPLRRIRGEIRDDDYPDHLREAGVTGTVGLRFVVGVNGRVTSCSVTRSSGVAELDTLTCRLIVRRFRYRPTIDARGRPVADVVTGEQGWGVDEYGRPLGGVTAPKVMKVTLVRSFCRWAEWLGRWIVSGTRRGRAFHAELGLLELDAVWSVLLPCQRAWSRADSESRGGKHGWRLVGQRFVARSL